PCGRTNTPSPHALTNVPSGSKTTTGCSPRQKTKTRSRETTATPTTSTNDQPAGSRAQSGTGVYRYFPLPTVTTASCLFMLADLPEVFIAAHIERPAGDGRSAQNRLAKLVARDDRACFSPLDDNRHAVFVEEIEVPAGGDGGAGKDPARRLFAQRD